VLLTFLTCGGRFPELRLSRVSAFCTCAAAFLLFAILLAGLAAPTVNAQSPARQFVFTSGQQSISAYQLDTSNGALTAVPGSPFSVRLNPVALAVNPAGTLLFAANDDNNVSVYSINTMTGAIAEVPNSPFATGLGQNPVFLATDPSGKFLYVANQIFALSPGSDFGEIDAYAIDSVTGQLTPTPNSTPPNIGASVMNELSGIYVHPNGRWIYFLSGLQFGSNVIQGFIIDPTTGDLTGAIPPANGPGQADGLTGDFGGHFLVNQFGTCVNLETLAISPVDGSLSIEASWTAIDAPGFPSCFGGHSMAVDSSGNFMVMSFGTFTVTGGTLVPAVVSPTTPFPNGPWLADPLGPFVFALGGGLNSYSLDPLTGALAPAPGSPYPGGSAIAITGFPFQVPAPGAQYSPGSLQFTNSVVGVPGAPQMIDLVNTGTATLNITSISVTGANNGDFVQTNTCAATVAAGAKCTFTVTFTPSTTEPESASIRVVDNAAGSPHLAPLTSTGVVLTPPSPSLNPLSLTFPSTAVGSTATMSFSIMNSGDQTLTVSSVSIGGANPGDFSQTNSCSSVNGNSSCSVNVVFQPKAAGQRTASVSVSYGGNLPGGSVALTGLGAAFTVAPSGPTSATVAPGQSANYTASFAPAPGFAGTATFTCTVAPVGPGCSVSPPTLQIVASNNPATMPITVTATPSASAAVRRSSGFIAGTDESNGLGQTSLPIRVSFVSLGFALLALLVFVKTPMGTVSSRRVQWSGVAAIFAIAALGIIASCGGGSNAPPPQPQNFTVTLTSTAGTTTQTVNFTLTVQ
jgi:Abnormal spindle-like microcephaly-assoc'd, ASPM-SPD-2-Hydin/Lactonase, 7-bladed beta-propeller